MPNNKLSIIGLMSGSSLDGLDMALCSFDKKGAKFIGAIKNAITVPFPKTLRERLSKASSLDAQALAQLDYDFGKWCGQQVVKHFSANKFSAIASHGHTVFHEPQKGYSLQIGSGAAIATIAGKPCINDFRNSDIAWGGQGAPLVPFGEKHLFDKMDAFLNLGGIANISFLNTSKPYAYDICGCNQWLNAVAAMDKKPFDKDGKMAMRGICNEALINQFNSWHFYKKSAPKSLSNQEVREHFSKNINLNLSPKDLSASLVEHIANKISEALIQNQKSGKVLITGGGAFHPLLLEKIKQKSNWNLIIPDSIKVQFKEAYIFAFLGYCRLLEIPNTVSKLTGASKDTCSGAVYLP
jgi:anhydro-N-acetylmuramic acid kinase